MIDDPMFAARIERRLQLRARGFMPIPLHGKIPPMKAWQQITVISADMLRLWGISWPDAVNTGVLTRYTPALDLDILNEEAARACEMLIDRDFGDRGRVLVRIGKPPKRAILFHTNAPFKKITLNLIAANLVQLDEDAKTMAQVLAVAPFACMTPDCILAAISVSALPMSIWPQQMSNFRQSREIYLVRPVTACLVEV